MALPINDPANAPPEPNAPPPPITPPPMPPPAPAMPFIFLLISLPTPASPEVSATTSTITLGILPAIIYSSFC